jgi:hypothetical protein
MKLESGDIFSIKTSKGFGFLQYVETDDLGIEYVRILFPLKNEKIISQAEVDLKERWSIGFPLKAATRKKLVMKIGNFDFPINYKADEYARSEHNVGGEHLGWRIIHRKSLKGEFKNKLENEDMKLSPHGIFNDTLIIEYLEKDWKLENWK